MNDALIFVLGFATGAVAMVVLSALACIALAYLAEPQWSDPDDDIGSTPES